MNFEALLRKIGDEPVFESSFLLAGDISPAYLRLQLTRWVKAGKLYQLRRGLYCLTPPYRKTIPHPFVIANRLVSASYVSGITALAFYGLIPDIVHLTISVTGTRPGRWETPLGDFEFRHVQPQLLMGYQSKEMGEGQQTLVALPEKAILDLVYLQPGGDDIHYLRSLRLQNLELLDLQILRELATLFDSPKMTRAAQSIAQIAEEETGEYKTL